MNDEWRVRSGGFREQAGGDDLVEFFLKDRAESDEILNVSQFTIHSSNFTLRLAAQPPHTTRRLIMDKTEVFQTDGGWP